MESSSPSKTSYLPSTDAKAKQTKEYIEGFYRNLRNNYLVCVLSLSLFIL